MHEYSFCAYAYTCKFFLNSACLERLYLLCKIDLGVLSSFIKIIRMIIFSRFLYSSLLKEKSQVLSGLRLFRLFLLETNPKFDATQGSLGIPTCKSSGEAYNRFDEHWISNEQTGSVTVSQKVFFYQSVLHTQDLCEFEASYTQDFFYTFTWLKLLSQYHEIDALQTYRTLVRKKDLSSQVLLYILSPLLFLFPVLHLLLLCFQFSSDMLSSSPMNIVFKIKVSQFSHFPECCKA